MLVERIGVVRSCFGGKFGVPEAAGGYAIGEPSAVRVLVDDAVAEAFAALPERARRVISESLALDARPAQHDDPERIYGVGMCGRNVRFRMEDGLCRVLGLESSEGSGLNL
jgi:hypothetical protein